MSNVKSTKARVVVVEKVYHQQDPEPPTLVESVFSRFLDSEDSPLVRRTRVGQDWQRLCPGGLIEFPISAVVIQNLEGRSGLVQPTEEEKKEVASRVLAVGVEAIHQITPRVACISAFSEVHPGESIRIYPTDLTSLYIRCRSGDARYCLAVFPS